MKVSWLFIALALSAGLRGLLRKTGMNEKLPDWLE